MESFDLFETLNNEINESIGALKPINLTNLVNKEFDPLPEIVASLLTPGLFILAGSPKVGKSFLSLQLAYCVSKGEPFLGHSTMQSDVLYMALEDSERRLQDRICKIFGYDSESDNLYLLVKATTIADGIIGQLETYIRNKPDTRLIIIDTLAKIRNGSSTYHNDYQELGGLKEFADANGICILLVHHTVKGKISDPFRAISGSQGIYGTADGAMVLMRSDDGNDYLFVQGRDVPSGTYRVSFDNTKCCWMLLESSGSLDQFIHPYVKAIGDKMKGSGKIWEGTATQLIEDTHTLAEMHGVKANTVTKIFNRHISSLRDLYDIEYSTNRTASGRTITLRSLHVDESVEDDSSDFVAQPS